MVLTEEGGISGHRRPISIIRWLHQQPSAHCKLHTAHCSALSAQCLVQCGAHCALQSALHCSAHCFVQSDAVIQCSVYCPMRYSTVVTEMVNCIQISIGMTER